MNPFVRHVGRLSRTGFLAGLACLSLRPAQAGGDDPVVAIQQQTFVTADLSADACDRATETVITVEEDTVVQYCFSVRNIGTVALTSHDVVTDSFGKLVSMLPLTLAPGQSIWRSHQDLVVDDRTTTSTWVARDTMPAYAHSATTYDFTDISTTGTSLGVVVFFAQSVTLPFSVRLYGHATKNVSVCNLGVIELDGTREVCTSPGPLPNDGMPLSLMPWWDDLDSNGGGVWYQVTGSEPHRKVIVQWQRGHAPFIASNHVIFQAVMAEDSDEIVFQYKDVSFGLPGYDAGGTATIGLNYDANLAHAYSVDTPSLVDGQAIRWTPNVWRTAQASSSATVIVHAARVDVGTRALQSRQPPGRVTTRGLAFSNTGLVPLRWHFDEAQANSRAHIPRSERLAVAKSSPERMQASPLERAYRPSPLQAPKPSGTSLPTAYGRDGWNGDFIRIDLSNAAVTGINLGERAPVSNADFLDGDFTRLYSLSGNLTSQVLIAVDPAVGQFAFIGPSNPAPGQAWSGIAGDSTSGTMYASTVDFFVTTGGEAFCGPDSRLYRVNPSLGTPRLIGRIAANSCVRGIATNANGEMFGVDIQNDTLLAIDKTTGVGSVIGPLGFDAGHDVGLDFDEDANVLYLVAMNFGSRQSELRTVNTSTGATTLVAPFIRDGLDAPDIIALAVASGGHGCVDPATVPWLSVTPASGTTSPGGSDVVTVRFDSTGLAAGRYEALLCLFSNDPRNRFVTLPVRLDVDPDAIFADGFE